MVAKCSKSIDKSSLLQSHKIGSNPNCIAGAKLVDQDKDGMMIESPIFNIPDSIKA